MRIMLTVVALFLATACISGAEKITVDPNTALPKSAGTAADAADANLAQKVTYEARHKRVCVVVEELAKITGVALKAGYNNQDWQVRDRKVSVFAKEVPLSRLMNSIARAMRFKWSKKSGVDPPVYRLYMDRKVLLGAEAQEARKQERRNLDLAQKRKKALETYEAAARLSPGELARLKEESPFAYIVAASGAVGILETLMREVPAVARAMDSGGEVTLSISQLTPEGRQVLERGVLGLQKCWYRLGAWRLNDEVDPNAGFENATITLNTNAWGVEPWSLGRLVVSWDCGPTDLPILDPDSDLARAAGNLLTRTESGPLDEVESSALREQFAGAWKHTPRKEDHGEPVAEHPDDPDLLRQIDLGMEEAGRLDDVLAALSKASDFPVVADSCAWARAFRKTSGKTQMKSMLDGIAKDYRMNWDKQAGVIEFRDRDWLANRSKQIPEEWIEKWRRVFKKNGTLDLPVLAEIARLTQEQVEANLEHDEVLQVAVYDVFCHREFLLMYESLTEDQRAAVFSGGLDVDLLTPEQRSGVDELIESCGAALLKKRDIALTLTGTRTKEGKRFSYHFTVSTPDDPSLARWDFTTPEYFEPSITPSP